VLLNLGVSSCTDLNLARAEIRVFKIVTLMVAGGSLAVASLGYLFGSVGGLYLGLGLIGLLVIGGQQNAPAISVQLYPRRMRSTGVGWQFAAGRLGSILGPIIGGRLLGGERFCPIVVLADSNSTLLASCVHGGRLLRQKSGAPVSTVLIEHQRLPTNGAGRAAVRHSRRANI